MYLKTLTLRGFKSFASATTLRFEPGITCVVGPNGSGKSNVVDAFSWVMGQQGAKQLRGGKMEDVVFAGTAGRPALGRAEVTLTIDNSDGALPIDYAEVTISRLLFRTGQSEYAINGSQCRLLDIQELLSDTGLGREMHVIVGQGHLDDILNAGPEARRALIEEAAGVLKHRRRKEKALRKLDAMQANLTRLVDLTTELGRQLKPLGRQAQLARRAAVIQADLRDARLRLLADDYVTLRRELERDEADETAATALRSELEAVLAQARQQEADLEAAEQQHAPRLAVAQQTYFELGGLAERLRAVADVADERHRYLSAPPEQAGPSRDPDELEREAAELREQELALSERLAAARDQLAAAVAARTAAEAALAETERKIAADARAAAERAERIAKLRGQADAARGRLAAAQEEAGRLAKALAGARTRAGRAQQQYAELQDSYGGTDEDRAELAAAHERCAAAVAAAAAQVKRLRADEHAISDTRAGLRARVTALQEAVRRGADASELLLSGDSGFHGVLGTLAEKLTVADGAAEAITAALGASAGAVAVSDHDAAVAALKALRERRAGRADLVIAGAPGDLALDQRQRDWQAGAVIPAIELVQAPPELAETIRRLLAGIVVVPDLATGLDRVRQEPDVAVVTVDGDLLGAHWARGGAAQGESLLGLKSAAAQAAAELAEAETAAQRAERELAYATEEEEQARHLLAEAQARLQEVDASAAELSGKLGSLAGAARAAQDEAARLATSIAAADRAAEKSRTSLAEIQEKLARAERQGDPGEDTPLQDGASAVPPGGQAALADSAAAARNAEMDARLEVRTAEERLRAISGRADALASAAVSERTAIARAAERARRRAAEAVVARAVATGARRSVEAVGRSLRLAEAERQQAELARQERDVELKTIRARIRETTSAFDKVVDTAHSAEVARASRKLRLDQAEARAVEELAIDVETLVTDYGPDVLVPMLRADGQPGTEGGHEAAGDDAVSAGLVMTGGGGAAGGGLAGGGPNGGGPDGGGPDGAVVRGVDGVAESVSAIPYRREEQQRRADAAQRQLDRLGKVNPLALEEFAALEERHAFLVTQLEDLRKTRKDLLTVVKEVDDRVQQVFAGAYADTAREFERIFARLFPGGEGRLILTEPDDMLTTGIEFEARPPGKKVKRLSLLSGGERSLTAIAFLVAIFKARPSPFYVMDEVEAALDDTNVQRLLDIFEELRSSSQLIIITHQKRTMEIADSLYGVTMRSDGVSAVISQRLRERESA